MGNDSKINAKDFLLGALIGGTIGAITALLLAPKSGKELRQDIALKSSEMADKANDMWQNVEKNVGTTVGNVVQEAKSKAQTIISSAKVQADNLLSSAEKVLSEAKDKASTAKETVQQKIDTLKSAAKASADAFNAEIKHIEE